MAKYVTIVGSRSCTKKELRVLKEMAQELHKRGFTLRSGGAYGADSVINHLANVEIIIPWNGFNGLVHDGKRIFVLDKLPNRDVARKTIQSIHPAPHRLTRGAWNLHMRNVYQVTGVEGVNRQALSERVYYIADEHDGNVKGGTATAVNLARKLGIKTVNIRQQK